LWDDDEVRDAGDMEELRAEIQAACGFDLLDPPGWARDDLAYLTGADPTEDGRDDDAGRDREDEDRDDDRDRASDSPGGDRSGETDDNESDEQEERHEDDDAGSRSSDDEWRDRQE
jgi:hypothetical protein